MQIRKLLQNRSRVKEGQDGLGDWYVVSDVIWAKVRSNLSQGVRHRARTLSKLTLMLPTFVAPTGTMPKNPYRHRPNNATRSFKTNRFARRLAMYGETENNSPRKKV